MAEGVINNFSIERYNNYGGGANVTFDAITIWKINGKIIMGYACFTTSVAKAWWDYIINYLPKPKNEYSFRIFPAGATSSTTYRGIIRTIDSAILNSCDLPAGSYSMQFMYEIA